MSAEPIRILRLFCPPCRKTRSVLPRALPPICRWDWSDLLRIGERLAAESAYAIAKSIRVSLSSLLHLESWIIRAAAAVLGLAREKGLLDQMPPRPAPINGVAALELARYWPRWAEFTHSFSRAFYPKRFPLLSSHTILTG